MYCRFQNLISRKPGKNQDEDWEMESSQPRPLRSDLSDFTWLRAYFLKGGLQLAPGMAVLGNTLWLRCGEASAGAENHMIRTIYPCQLAKKHV